ncbi:Glutamate carboxypeptidase 2 [Wickerhamomyces ciferrii]|uniref:Glutamate carboxypeptidase 2 n=1 Tax=Wickerhamomyces ciferrii (strain ATCC 14091 / BCRC 22168 / CBS 111 / JCM 3599 / NBRC 0793 / NRRL Y-1031 F-60-10) TaxID=1206466 RepID=K0KNY1_WICCF|nr:Glutamate carboxypeptidase 2 [Wickerhamomyces ciferrii]CCH46985.1 Glutamate carboxypeptidase 2 [Wickerhamomyces ciferrii]
MSDDLQPLLPSNNSSPNRPNRRGEYNRARSASAVSAISTSIESVKEFIKDNWPSLTTQKFVAGLVWAILAVVIFNLIFLPRTSLGRDYRRIHFSKLSKVETQRLFLKSLADQNNAGEYLYNYTHSPHLTGEGDDLTQFTFDKFKEFGFKPYKEKYQVWYNKHIANGIKLLNPDDDIIYEPTLQEDEFPEDKAANNSNVIPAFHAYSANGNVTAKFIYANYGSLEDYNQLKKAGVDTKDKIHIIRYNKLFRGLKVKHAEKAGAIGVLIYTDPYDDGEVTVKNGYEAYPKGRARNPSSIQRGSVGYFTDQPGDPTTPGYASFKLGKREDPSPYIPGIPSVPISYKEVIPILQTLDGLGSKFGWRGDVDDYDYSTGPSEFTINLYNEQDYQIRPITNVLYVIPGLLNEKVFIGNHRDSWTTSGAGDPGSGSAILLEITRAFGELIKKGWKPLRTIVVASWDGEEFGMLGSTEYGEYHKRDLSNNVISYLNLDMGVIGNKLQVDSNPLLDHFLIESSKYIPFDNASDFTLHDYWKEQSNNSIDILGAGSDFTVFQHHLGIPSCMVYFNNNGSQSPLNTHSNYDSYHWIKNFVDPEFKLHNTLAKYFGFLALSISENEVFEYKIAHYSLQISKFFNQIKSKIPQDWLNKQADKHHRLYELIEQLESILGEFYLAAKEFDKTEVELQKQISIDYPWFKIYKKIQLAINIKLLGNRAKQIDRTFLHKDGLKNRPWMKHIILAPDRDNGYQGDVLPGLHEALKDGDFLEFVKWIKIVKDKLKIASYKANISH